MPGGREGGAGGEGLGVVPRAPPAPHPGVPRCRGGMPSVWVAD